MIGLVFFKIFCSIFRFFVPNPKKDVRGEIVLISGAGSGLGRLMSLRFAKLGAIVVCTDINKQANDAVVEEIKSTGGEAHGYKCDCSSRDDIYRVADLVKQQVGEVTILVNNAGIVSGKKFLETDDRMIQKTMEVNTMAHFWVRRVFMVVKSYIFVSLTVGLRLKVTFVMFYTCKFLLKIRVYFLRKNSGFKAKCNR